MYIIKHNPEDFKVKEVTNLKIDKGGDYTIFLLKKKDYTTIKALEKISDKLNIKLKKIGFAGTKDKKAITEQYISLFNINKNRILNLKIKDIELKYIGQLNKPISLGDLKGNRFKIIIRNLNKNEIRKFERKKEELNKIPNYFGEQRFSKNNKKLGKLIVKGEFEKTTKLILENDKEYGEKLNGFLKKNKNNYTVALKLIPFKILKLYVHSYQSYLWNQTAEKVKNNDLNIKIPIVGFGTELKDDKTGKMIREILEKEKINLRDFIIKKIPDLSSEGTERNLFIKIKDFKYKIEEDIIKLIFFLGKGSYATTLIEYLLN